ncbi:MAG: helix-turn-helix domain-containing protein [Oscillospiraceae bacterium]|nr:helix-turn-helix domain-containing protein [Oscillospiraceae bacterium]
MEWMTVKETSQLWNVSGRRVQILCDTGKVNGATRLGNMWIIPRGTPKPIDGRTKAARAKKQQESD